MLGIPAQPSATCWLARSTSVTWLRCSRWWPLPWQSFCSGPRPWVCLLCPLAVFAPRHAANLLRLKAFFSRQWQQMSTAQFVAVFGPYSHRIDEVLDRFDPALLAHAARDVADDDIELPLRPEETTR